MALIKKLPHGRPWKEGVFFFKSFLRVLCMFSFLLATKNMYSTIFQKLKKNERFTQPSHLSIFSVVTGKMLKCSIKTLVVTNDNKGDTLTMLTCTPYTNYLSVLQLRQEIANIEMVCLKAPVYFIRS